MAVLRVALAAIFLLWAVVFRAALADERDAAKPARENDRGLLTISGRVVLPGGGPAAGATVRSVTDYYEQASQAVTSDDGSFQLDGLFGNGVHLHASTADGMLQTKLAADAGAARKVLASPVVLTLRPADTHRVVVHAHDRPVEGAQVAAIGFDFKVHGVTNRDGTVELRQPSGDRPHTLVAWHPKMGVAGTRDLTGLSETQTEFSLRAPHPYAIRIIDIDGKAIAGLGLTVCVKTEDSEWIPVAAHVFDWHAGSTITMRFWRKTSSSSS